MTRPSWVYSERRARERGSVSPFLLHSSPKPPAGDLRSRRAKTERRPRLLVACLPAPGLQTQPNLVLHIFFLPPPRPPLVIVLSCRRSDGGAGAGGSPPTCAAAPGGKQPVGFCQQLRSNTRPSRAGPKRSGGAVLLASRHLFQARPLPGSLPVPTRQNVPSIIHSILGKARVFFY